MSDKPTKQQLIADYAELGSLAAVAERHGVSLPGIRYWFKRYGIPYDAKPQAKPCPDVPKLRQMLEVQGLSYKKVRDHFGVGHGQVCKWVKEHGINPVTRKLAVKAKIPPRKVLEDLYWHRNLPISEIAKRFEVSDPTVKKWFVSYGIRIREHSNTISLAMAKFSPRPPREELFRLYHNKQLSFSEIAKHYGMAQGNVVAKWFPTDNIPTRTFRETMAIAGQNKALETPAYDDLLKRYDTQKQTLSEMGEFYGVCTLTMSRWLTHYGIKLRDRSEAITRSLPKMRETNVERYGQPYYRYTRHSKGEKEMGEFLNSHGFDFRQRGDIIEGLELDLYDENIKVAIEYNGEFFHSEKYRDKNYHLNKMLACQEQGIRLLQFYDWTEWRSRNAQVKNFLLVSLGRFEKRVYARQCEVRKLDTPDWQYLEDNHIQGAPQRVTVMYGFLYKDEMIGAVSYAPHDRNNRAMTLNRLCFLAHVQCVGGASKLVRNSIIAEGFDEVITWSDNRWTEGHVYEKIGFTLDHECDPDYSYTDGRIVRSKQSVKKSATGCPKYMTEHEWALEHGWFRLYDCGKKKWLWKK